MAWSFYCNVPGSPTALRDWADTLDDALSGLVGEVAASAQRAETTSNVWLGVTAERFRDHVWQLRANAEEVGTALGVAAQDLRDWADVLEQAKKEAETIRANARKACLDVDNDTVSLVDQFIHWQRYSWTWTSPERDVRAFLKHTDEVVHNHTKFKSYKAFLEETRHLYRRLDAAYGELVKRLDVWLNDWFIEPLSEATSAAASVLESDEVNSRLGGSGAVRARQAMRIAGKSDGYADALPSSSFGRGGKWLKAGGRALPLVGAGAGVLADLAEGESVTQAFLSNAAGVAAGAAVASAAAAIMAVVSPPAALWVALCGAVLSVTASGAADDFVDSLFVATPYTDLLGFDCDPDYQADAATDKEIETVLEDGLPDWFLEQIGYPDMNAD
jgi:uncharacterized protein YukE